MLPATDVFFWPMSNLFIDILNYAVRISIVLLGILIAGGFVMQMPGEEWYSEERAVCSSCSVPIG